MRIGFALPVSGSWATPENVVHVAGRAQALGYHAVWTFQRLLSTPDWAPVYRSVLDPLTTLAYAAAVTTDVRLGVAVVNLPFVTPVLLAKQAATLDVLSGGRLDLGLGLGWADEEYRASGVSKRHQVRRAEEFIATVRTLWTQGDVAHDGEFYHVPPSNALPKPVQPGGPPILLGGLAPGALARAGRLADGWVSSSRADLSGIGDAVGAVKRSAEQAGRDPESLRFICRGVVKVRSPGAASTDAPLTGTFDTIRADIARLGEQGITELFVDLNFDDEIGSPDADPATSLARADEALAALAPAPPW
ncbi:MAG TPA: TIGR03619 family F420-dependent LLM class oxidoreductase [Micromonosporaceae bacterium]